MEEKRRVLYEKRANLKSKRREALAWKKARHAALEEKHRSAERRLLKNKKSPVRDFPIVRKHRSKEKKRPDVLSQARREWDMIQKEREARTECWHLRKLLEK